MFHVPYQKVEFVKQSLFLMYRIKQRRACFPQDTHFFGTAAVALTQLKYLDEDNSRRREIVRMYNEGFKDNPNIQIVPANYADECSYHLYELVVPDREDLLQKLSENDINCGVHYRDNTEYKIFSFGEGSCNKAREVSHHLITLPLHMWLTDADVEYIIKKVNQYA